MVKALTEFELINRFFSHTQTNRRDVLVGVGDDAAILQVPSNQLLVTATDTLVAGVHFLEDWSPSDIGYKSLAVNLSDLAAMGAEPAWVMLSLTLPEANEKWLADFAQGFFELINRFNLQLIGGDTTRGPLSITVQVMGFVPSVEKSLRRSGAQVGDKIYVTGTLGSGGLAVQLLRNELPATLLDEQQKQDILKCLNRPEPRIQVGLALRGIASSAIDISDGLAGDLNHILAASQVGAKVMVYDLPLHPALEKLDRNAALQLALNTGDAYELCFTVSPAAEKNALTALAKLNIPCACIGVIEAQAGLRLQNRNGQALALSISGYQHFH